MTTILDDQGRERDIATLPEGAVVVGTLAGQPRVLVKEGGKLTALSSVCTHRGCRVQFNATERTLDCPCHGSRFQLDGSVLEGPAPQPLPSVSLPTE